MFLHYLHCHFRKVPTSKCYTQGFFMLMAPAFLPSLELLCFLTHITLSSCTKDLAFFWICVISSGLQCFLQIFKEASSHSWLLLNSFLNPPLIFTYSSIKLRLPLQYLGDSWLLGWTSRAGLFISLRFNFVRFTHYSILSFSDPDLSSNMFAILPISANSPGMISIFSKSVIKVVK